MEIISTQLRYTSRLFVLNNNLYTINMRKDFSFQGSVHAIGQDFTFKKQNYSVKRIHALTISITPRC